VQTDVKKLVAYSSVSHLGFCVLGCSRSTPVGLTGSVLYMINHGLSTGALFLLIGFMYERYHTRDMREIGGLAAKMPVWSFFMVFFVMASVGPARASTGSSASSCALMGTFQSYTPWTGRGRDHGGARPGARSARGSPSSPATGVIVAAIYLLYMTSKVVWGTLREPAGTTTTTACCRRT
jgi:NADH-quinone oxidoreductase subunit M